MSTQRWVRKTVIIGLGGTGRDVVLNIKRKYREVYGTEEVPTTRFLVFDTADAKALSVPGSEDIELSPAEFCKLGLNSPALAVKANEEIADWFPERDIPMLSINRGASQIRALGRLALYGNAREVYTRIKQAIDGVNSILPHQPLGQFRITGDSVLVNIVSSLSGGTGSGTVLDVAYVCREHMRSATDTLSAYLLLPDVFTSLTATENVEANAYAALSELDYLTEQARFTAAERSFSFGGRQISMVQQPFDTIYLVNNRNQRGQVYETVPEVTELIGLGIFVATGAPGKEALDVWDNLQHQVPRDIQGKRPFYASFGVSELALDLQGRAEREARRLAGEALRTTFLTEPRPGDADADEFVRSVEMGAGFHDTLVRDVSVGVSGDGIGPDGLINFVNSERQTVLGRIDAAVRDTTVPEAFGTGAQDALAARVARMFEGSDGVARAAGFLDALATLLDARVTTLESEIEEHRKQADQARLRAEGLQRKALEVHKKSRWFGRTKACGAVAKSYAATVQSEAQHQLQLKRKERGVEVLAPLRRLARDHHQVIGALRELAERVAPSLVEQAEMHTGVEPFTIRIPCPDTRLEHVSVEAGSMAHWFAGRGLEMATVAALPPPQFRALVMEFAAAQPSVRKFADVTISDALGALDDSAQREYMHDLEALAAPLWQYEPAYLPAGRGTQTIQILGVPDADSDLEHLLPTMQSGRRVQRVTTNDAHRIYCYKVEAAIPAFMLAGARRYKARYDAISGSTALHTDRSFESAPEIMPDLEKMLAPRRGRDIVLDGLDVKDPLGMRETPVPSRDGAGPSLDGAGPARGAPPAGGERETNA